jgi:hypothetical protein
LAQANCGMEHICSIASLILNGKLPRAVNKN